MNRIGFGPACEAGRYASGGFCIPVSPFFFLLLFGGVSPAKCRRCTRVLFCLNRCRFVLWLVESLPIRSLIGWIVGNSFFGWLNRCWFVLWLYESMLIRSLIVESFPARFGRVAALIHLRCGCSEDEWGAGAAKMNEMRVQRRWMRCGCSEDKWDAGAAKMNEMRMQ